MNRRHPDEALIETASPARHAGPPHHQARQAQRHGHRAQDAVPPAARPVEEQLVMQSCEPEHEELALRDRIAEVLTGVGVESFFFPIAVALHPDLDCRVASRDAVADPRNRVARISALGQKLQLVRREAPGLGIEGGAGRAEQRVELVAVHQHAAGDAQHHQVEAEAETGPQVNLEQRAPQPDCLRLPYPLRPQAHARELCTSSHAAARRARVRTKARGLTGPAAPASAAEAARRCR